MDFTKAETLSPQRAITVFYRFSSVVWYWDILPIHLLTIITSVNLGACFFQHGWRTQLTLSVPINPSRRVFPSPHLSAFAMHVSSYLPPSWTSGLPLCLLWQLPPKGGLPHRAFRDWVMPPVVPFAEFCSRISLQDWTSQCNSTFTALSAVPFSFICCRSVADLFLRALREIYSSASTALLFFKVILPTESHVSAVLPKGLLPVEKRRCTPFRPLWRFMIRETCSDTVVSEGVCAINLYKGEGSTGYLTSLLHISVLWRQLSSNLWSPNKTLNTQEVLKINIISPCRAHGYFNRAAQSRQFLTAPV